MARHITDDLDTYSDDTDEEQIKTKCPDVFSMKQFLKMSFFIRAIVKMSFLKKQF